MPEARRLERQGIVIHRRAVLEVTTHLGIPVTPPVFTLIDIAPRLTRAELERAISEADNHDLIDPETLRVALDDLKPRPGIAVLRETLDRHTFRLTDSELERILIPIAVRAGLGTPQTQQWVNGFKVDFYWPDLNLVVEADSLRYHRTPAQQTIDRRRDHAHAAAGTERLRFSHAQVAYEPSHIEETLTRVARRLSHRPVSWQTAPRR